MDNMMFTMNDGFANPAMLDLLFLVILLVAVLLLVRNRKKTAEARKQVAQKIKSRKNTLDEGPDTPVQEAAPVRSGREDVMEVSEVDPLDGVDIYIEYGYYERAAETLRWYVEQAGGGSNPNALRKLLEVYFQLGQIDNYASTLEQIALAGERPDFIKVALLAGLREDYDNLQLRVLAEAHLDMGVERLNAMIGSPRRETKSIEVKREPAHEVPPVEAPKPPRVSPQPKAERAIPQQRKKLALVQGDAPLAPLTTEEKSILKTLVSPAHVAKLYLALMDEEEAVPALRQAIAEQPRKSLVHFTEMLKIFYLKRDLDEYAKTLWHLYSILENYGQDLKERLLGAGFDIGYHPVLEALAQAKEPHHIEAIGRTYGYFPTESATAKKLSLIEVRVESAGPELECDGDSVLAEVDSYIEYGQIEQALELLEREILIDPQRVQLYQPLLDLYDRMDALQRFTRLASEIKKKMQRPPDEVISMMSSLYKRLQQRTQRIAA